MKKKNTFISKHDYGCSIYIIWALRQVHKIHGRQLHARVDLHIHDEPKERRSGILRVGPNEAATPPLRRIDDERVVHVDKAIHGRTGCGEPVGEWLAIHVECDARLGHHKPHVGPLLRQGEVAHRGVPALGVEIQNKCDGKRVQWVRRKLDAHRSVGTPRRCPSPQVHENRAGVGVPIHHPEAHGEREPNLERPIDG